MSAGARADGPRPPGHAGSEGSRGRGSGGRTDAGMRAGDGAPPPEPEPRSGTPPEEPAAPTCEVCGTPMYERHCKILCPVCGYQRDCSDP